jgi:hypothetical protein
MIKILFFDYRELEKVNGFTKQLERPEKYSGNPLFCPDSPWENGNMQLYGSVVKAPGKPGASRCLTSSNSTVRKQISCSPITRTALR